MTQQDERPSHGSEAALDASGELVLFREPDGDEAQRDPSEDGTLSTLAIGPAPSTTEEAHAVELVVAKPRPVRVIAIAGAKGGTGKTLVAANLALYLSTIGRKVVVVDAASEGANIHTFLGVESPRRLPQYALPPAMCDARVVVPRSEPAPAANADAASRTTYDILLPEEDTASAVDSTPPPSAETPTSFAGISALADTPIPGLRLMRTELGETSTAANRRLEHLRVEVRKLDAEYVVVDLGGGAHPRLLDFWLAADVPLFVTQPEPTAIENTYHFIRAAFARHVLRSVRGGRVRRLKSALHAVDGAPSPLDFVRSLEHDGDDLASVVRDAIESFRFKMVINQTRLRADLELGDAMRCAARRRLGIRIDYLGYIDYDDTVWSCVRMRRPLLVESPGTKASRNIEKLARRVHAMLSGKERARPTRSVPSESHHDLLEVDRGDTEEEIRRAYKRVKEIYAPDSLCCYGLFDPSGLETLRARLDEAYDVLLDPARRRPYELSVFPAERDTMDAPLAETAPAEPKPPPPVITPDTEFTGAVLRALRESQGVELRDVSSRTKVGLAYLKAIEDEDFASLPATVYVRGFVTELAKCLRLDPAHVSRTYIRRYRRQLDEHPKA